MELKKLLKDVGFTEYESKVYLALSQMQRGKASEISVKSGVPQNKVYECLVRLAEKGFVASLDVTPRQYKVLGVQPFKDILDERKKELDSFGEGIGVLEEQLKKKQFDLEDIAVVLKGKKKIIQMLNEITPKLQKYQYNFGGNLIFSHTSARLVKDAIKRGVEFRFIVHWDPARKDVYRKWQKVGVKIRFYPKEEQKSIRFSAFDDKIARTTIGKPQIRKEDDYLSFWVESPAFALLLKDQFLEMWEKSEKRLLVKARNS